MHALARRSSHLAERTREPQPFFLGGRGTDRISTAPLLPPHWPAVLPCVVLGSGPTVSRRQTSPDTHWFLLWPRGASGQGHAAGGPFLQRERRVALAELRPARRTVALRDRWCTQDAALAGSLALGCSRTISRRCIKTDTEKLHDFRDGSLRGTAQEGIHIGGVCSV